MNYIPGFSNYLETSVPRYADGGAVMGGAPYGEPEMQFMEDAPSMLDAGGINNSYGERMTSGYTLPTTPPSFFRPYEGMSSDFVTKDGKQGYYFSTDKGASAGYKGQSGFVASDPNAQYRLTDERGKNKIVYSGQGEEGLRNVYQQANELSISGGKEANWGVEMLDPATGKWTRVVENDPAKGLGIVGDVVGTALPLAAMFVPGLNVLGTIALGAGLGGAGAALKGDNILKGAVMGGLSSAGGQILGPALEAGGKFGTALAPKLATAVGTGLGSTAGGLVTGQSLENALLSGVASGALSYVAPTVANELGLKPINLSGTEGTSGSSGMTADGGLQVTASTLGTPSGFSVSGGSPPSVKNPNDIVVDATKAIPPTSVSVPVTTGGLPTTTAQPNDIVVDATKAIPPTSVSVPVTTGGLPTTTAQPNDIVVTGGGKIEPTSVSVVPPIGSVVDTLPPLDLKPDPALTDKDGKKLGVEDYLRIAGLLSGLVGGAAGGGSGQTGTYTRGGGGLNPIFSAKLPSAGGLGTIGATRTQRPLGDVDWLTYGTRPELNFFDYAQSATPAPITTPVPNEPAGPAMYVPDDMRFAEGGAMPAKRGGASRRTEFAVNGPGTGRSDEIPAVLSDGEYVIDAETVALLGDGSSKAGAKKLDDLRVKVRKHKGKKLAKGRFSANAKKPEAYLSGGRI